PSLPSLRHRYRPCAGDDGGGPLTVDSRPTKGRPPLRPVPPSTLTAGLVTVDRPLQVGRWRMPLAACLPAAQSPFASSCPYSLGRNWSPLQRGLPWPAIATRGVAVIDRPCRGPGHG
ncbi:hypothetical protein BHE74_00008264, partial [Ensete ventricosum]